MAGRVIIPLDGSPLAEQALPLGASIARRMSLEILLVRVIPQAEVVMVYQTGGGAVVPHDESHWERAGAEQYLRAVASRLEELDIAVTCSVSEGNPAVAIAQVANETEPEYIVMSTRGRTGLSRLALGSVADQLLRQAEAPIIVLRPREVEPVERLELPPVERLLIPLDGSEKAERVLPHAKVFARAFGAHIYLMRTLSRYEAEADLNEATGEARAYLRRVATELRDAGFQVYFKVRNEADCEPCEVAILQFASAVRADLIAMTTRGRGGLARALLGSVTDHVLRNGVLPVMIVRS
jgi:nucleotide-binding universal stress UspA family protein